MAEKPDYISHLTEIRQKQDQIEKLLLFCISCVYNDLTQESIMRIAESAADSPIDFESLDLAQNFDEDEEYWRQQG